VEPKVKSAALDPVLGVALPNGVEEPNTNSLVGMEEVGAAPVPLKVNAVVVGAPVVDPKLKEKGPGLEAESPCFSL